MKHKQAGGEESVSEGGMRFEGNAGCSKGDRSETGEMVCCLVDGNVCSCWMWVVGLGGLLTMEEGRFALGGEGQPNWV